MKPEISTIATDTARQVLTWQSESLLGAAAKIGQSFDSAVQHLFETKGKIVTTGLGKSGHVARKMAATLSSTGSPSVFLHPTEALHGDLGVLNAGDALILIAFGGETSEVLEVAKFAKRRDLKTVAITGKLSSSLAKISDFVIDASIEREACLLNLAPTSSTTVAMALGDCIAIALMKLRGFTADDFAQFHPGGSLGRRLAIVQDLMRSPNEVEMISETDSFHTVLEKVTKNNFGLGIVSKDGCLVGMITDGDLRRALVRLEQEVFKLRACDLMTSNPQTTLESKPCLVAFKQMEEKKITSLVVISDTDKAKVVGLIRMHDLLAAKIV